jgi:hypothetical protein
MAEWLLLLLLVPAIVVPVVLLVGFAGCTFDPDTTRIIIDSATPNGVCGITLKWQLVPDPNRDYHPPLKFLVQRTTDSSTTTLEADARSSSFPDKGLLAATTYSYTVSAVFTFRSDVSSSPVSATTLPFQPTFPQQTLPNPDGGWQGWTLIQRIARLTTGGTQVRITLQASSAAGATGASIDRIYISQPAAPGMGINPWDSAADLTKIYDIMDTAGVPLVMAAGEIRTVPAANQTGVNYNLDPTQPLLIAIDFTDGRTTAPASAITYADMVSAVVDATAYFFQYAPPGQNPQPQAQLQTRAANFTTHIGRLYFQLIEVG